VRVLIPALLTLGECACPTTLHAVENARAKGRRRVLIVGLDPDAIRGIDAAAVRVGLQYGLARFEDSELIADQCLVPLDATAERRIVEALTGENYECVVVGGGIRKPEPLLELFEAVINLIRVHAPSAAIAFNTDGGTSLEAARRVLARRPE
jgi:hypothetical protein